MRKEKSPAFQFYPKDYLTDPNVLLMNSSEKGIYIDLLCHCWLQKSLPTSLEELAQFAKVDSRDFELAWIKIKKCFQLRRGRYHQKRLSKERGKQMRFSKAQSDRSKSGWSKYRVGKQSESTEGALSSEPGHSRGYALQFASSTAVTTTKETEETTKTKETNKNRLPPSGGASRAKANQGTASPPDYQRVVGHICSTYQRWKGIKYPMDGRGGKIVKALLGMYETAHLMAFWDIFLSRDWNWTNKDGKVVIVAKNLISFQDKIGIILEDSSWKERIKKYEPVIDRPGINVMLNKMVGIEDSQRNKVEIMNKLQDSNGG